MSKLKLINILKNKILEQAPIGFYDTDEEPGVYYTSDEETGKIEKVDINKPKGIDVSSLDQSYLRSVDSVRGAKYGWREAIMSLCSPVKTGKKGPRYCNYHWHAGRDYSLSSGHPLVLLKRGEVIENGYPSGYCFKLKHDDGSITKYCHCSEFYFNKGDIIEPGTIFALTGNKGPSTGPHLHFEYFPPGKTATTEKHSSGMVANVADEDPTGYDEETFAILKIGYEKEFKSSLQNSSSETKPKPNISIFDKLPQKVKEAINKLRAFGVNITDKHIEKEMDLEGETKEDAGGVNSTANNQILLLLSDLKQKFSRVSTTFTGYRSYDDQVENFRKKVQDDGRTIDDVQSYNTIPGFSQHHTGLAFDIISTDTSWWTTNSDVKKWVENNCEKYGFEITYTKDGLLRKPEPWHLFYTDQSYSSEEEEDDEDVKDDVTTNVETKRIEKPSYIISINDPNSKKIALIWGGSPSSSFGAKFMEKQGSSFFTNRNVIYSNYENSLSTIKQYLKDNGFGDYTINSVSGFSAGGSKTWNEINGSYDFVGLIDPTTPTLHTSLPSNVYLISNSANWSDTYKTTKDNLKAMEKSGVSTRVTQEMSKSSSAYNHNDLPKYFFEKYSSKM